MKLYISEDFYKNVPDEKIKQVRGRISWFYNLVIENKTRIFELPKGLWVKKIKSLNDFIFEFRVNSGDRILFKFLDSRNGDGTFNKEGEGGYSRNLHLLSYGNHDNVLVEGKRRTIERDNWIEYKKDEFNGVLDDGEVVFNIYNESNQEKEKEKIEKLINPSIIREVTSNENLEILEENWDEYDFYYLNEEQVDILESEPPLLVSGSAGSGKTTIAIRKVMELEERYSGERKDIAYLTFSRSLKEEAKKFYEKYKKKDIENRVKFYTIQDLYDHLLGRTSFENHFEKFLMVYNPTRPKGIDDKSLYQEIRGIVKGGAMGKGNDQWFLSEDQLMMELQDYLNLTDETSNYKIEEKKIIHKIAQEYQKWLVEDPQKRKEDENDQGRRVIKKGKPIFDYLVCDEVQDLSEVEIYMLGTLVRNRGNILFGGDIHQIINPTYFSFSRLKSFYYNQENGKKDYTYKKLEVNYRNKKEVIDLANYVGKLRKDNIGSLKDDYVGKGKLKGGKTFLSKKDLKLLEELGGGTTIIIVPNIEEKRKLEKESKKLKGRISLVQEIKGLEFDSVALYNFGTSFHKIWEKIFTTEVKKDQRYRYYFNIFYVAITRARTTLLIMEERPDNPLIEKINGNLREVRERERMELTEKRDNLKLRKEGKKYLKKELFEQALKMFEEANAKELIKETKERLEARNLFDSKGEEESCDYILKNKTKVSTYLENYVSKNMLGEKALLLGRYEESKNYFRKVENNKRLGEVLEDEGNLEEALKVFIEGKEEESVERIKKDIAKNKKAMFLGKQVMSFSDKALKDEQISIEEFSGLNRNYIERKMGINFNEFQIIFKGRFSGKGEPSRIKSPKKLLIKLSLIKGGGEGQRYLLERYKGNIKIEKIIEAVDSPEILKLYMYTNKNKIKKLDLNFIKMMIEEGRLASLKTYFQLMGKIEFKEKEKDILLETIAGTGDIEVFNYLNELGVELKRGRLLYNSIKLKKRELSLDLLEKKLSLDSKEEGVKLFKLILEEKEFTIFHRLLKKVASLDYLPRDQENYVFKMYIDRNKLEEFEFLLNMGYKGTKEDIEYLAQGKYKSFNEKYFQMSEKKDIIEKLLGKIRDRTLKFYEGRILLPQIKEIEKYRKSSKKDKKGGTKNG